VICASCQCVLTDYKIVLCYGTEPPRGCCHTCAPRAQGVPESVADGRAYLGRLLKWKAWERARV
jgi:hypothetical protein